MATALLMPRFFVDETLLSVAAALTALRNDVIHTGHPAIPEVPIGTKDEDWIPVVAAAGLITIQRDRRILTRPGEKQLVVKHGLRIIRLAPKRDLNRWEYMRLLARDWDHIEDLIKELGDGPWVIKLLESRRPTHYRPEMR